ncbi:hypothetical protein CROQUDRAFT_655749 [Cronartium quercuum f. sp. fusiforme G11]|uniref:RNase III domain-containing protein n=1 Tax=Cronartium quercuum f. sp. fusiforme G11 TaxID=708437 RepID=A0A9P6NIS9_9BASI|nr:hypothetical protein CROQUDRAFT_655749 [Cronartium quercuum f. sp. fusiforme G11]
MKAIRNALQLGRTSASNSEGKTKQLSKIPLRCYPKNECSVFMSEVKITLFPRSHHCIKPIISYTRCYTTSVTDKAPSTRPPPPPQKKPASSFKAGPYRRAMLSPEPISTLPSPSTPNSHAYSPSKLRQLLKPPRSTPSRSALHFPHSDTIKQHLEELLYPLKFNDQLACRIVSSKNLIKSQASLDELKVERGDVGYAVLGEHNTKLSFMGRRMMHFALSDFLSNAPLATPLTSASTRLSAQILEDALLTKFVLGQYVGNQWELEKIMRWRELDGAAPGSSEIVGTGLWTARGHVVEAIMGAVMLQHGTRLSLAVFNSLVLPHLSFRLDPAFQPAIKALQLVNRELERPDSGLPRWKELDLTPFLKFEPTHEKKEQQLPVSSSQ